MGTSDQRIGYIGVWVGRVVALVAFFLPYIYLQYTFNYSGSSFPYFRDFSGIGFSYRFELFLFFEPVVVVVALFVSRKLLIAVGAFGLVLQLFLLFFLPSHPFNNPSFTITNYHWEIGAWLYLLSMMSLIVGSVLMMRGTKRPLATASTRV